MIKLYSKYSTVNFALCSQSIHYIDFARSNGSYCVCHITLLEGSTIKLKRFPRESPHKPRSEIDPNMGVSATYYGMTSENTLVCILTIHGYVLRFNFCTSILRLTSLVHLHIT